MKLMEKKDKLIFGIIAGLVAPVAGFFIYWQINFRSLELADFVQRVSGNSSRAALVSLCLLANLACFFFFLNRNMYRNARGVIAATFIYGAYIIYLKFF